MAVKRKKQSQSLLGALVIESVAVIVFVMIFVQARAERQKEAAIEDRQIPVLSSMFEQTPLHDLLVQNENESSFFEWN